MLGEPHVIEAGLPGRHRRPHRPVRHVPVPLARELGRQQHARPHPSWLHEHSGRCPPVQPAQAAQTPVTSITCRTSEKP